MAQGQTLGGADGAAPSPEGTLNTRFTMKYFLLIIAVCGSFAFALANGPKDKEIKCAVQGFKISIAQATKDKMFADYKGKRYFFCCNGCPQEFKANPAKFAKTAESIPTPKTAKPSAKK